jgi:RNA polymerase sigma factor (sigma-70 family)
MAAGDPEFEVVFDRLLSIAYRIASRMVGDRALAEDIAAETMARTYAHWPRIRNYEYLDAWVSRVSSNLALSAISKRGRSIPGLSEVSEPQDVAVLRIALVDALKHLPRRQREVVALRYFADQSEGAIASQLGVSAGSVKAHLHRGIGALRRALGPDFMLDIEEAP